MDPSTPGFDRQAYLAEQIERQKRGEPIDVDWVKAELDRVRKEQTERIAASQRRLRWLVVGAAVLLLILWFKNSSVTGGSNWLMLGLVVIGLLAAFGLTRKR
jgi:hypothetical protein